MLSAQFRFRSIVSISLRQIDKENCEKEAPGGPEASQEDCSALHGMSGDPFLGLTGHGDQCFQVVETERSPVAPHPGLIVERPREGQRGSSGGSDSLLARAVRLEGVRRTALAASDQSHANTS